MEVASSLANEQKNKKSNPQGLNFCIFKTRGTGLNVVISRPGYKIRVRGKARAKPRNSDFLSKLTLTQLFDFEKLDVYYKTKSENSQVYRYIRSHKNFDSITKNQFRRFVLAMYHKIQKGEAFHFCFLPGFQVKWITKDNTLPSDSTNDFVYLNSKLFISSLSYG